jgi:pyridoxal phosphate enzyme (YggS family)
VSSIRENLERVRESIERTERKTGRSDRVILVAVTKTVPPERINESIDAGVTIIGENRVAEAEEKHGLVKGKVTWHLVGHLQRNKVKKALPIFHMVQSIDKVETAVEMEKRASHPVDVLIEINSSGESSKSGIEPNRLFRLVDQLRLLKNIAIRGIMTVGPLTEDAHKIREAFRLTYRLFDELKTRDRDLDIRHLSMGMSSDYTIAIEEGSTMVRIGSAIYGPRTGSPEAGGL